MGWGDFGEEGRRGEFWGGEEEGGLEGVTYGYLGWHQVGMSDLQL